MADVITALAKKKACLCDRKRKIELDAANQINEINLEIAEIEKALKILNNSIKDYLCPRCNGSGSVRACDAAGQMEDDTCPVCHGIGVITE